MIAIIDYDTAQTDELHQALLSLGAPAELVNSQDRLERAHKIILPEAASFRRAIRTLRDRRLLGPIFRAADEKRAVLGIGTGFHLFFDVSYEEGQHTGLGLVHGKATRLDAGGHPSAAQSQPPHRGWNQVFTEGDRPIAFEVASGTSFFFDHSFHAEPLDERAVAASSNYGVKFSSVIQHGSVIGTQFIPERSEDAGRRFLAAFVEA